jgi:hypothetical protein
MYSRKYHTGENTKRLKLVPFYYVPGISIQEIPHRRRYKKA